MLEGLEISEVLLSEMLQGTETKRIDPEYFKREALRTEALITKHVKLGDLVADGYRVVYETTEAIDRSEGEASELPYFLQATDITTPFINAESMGCVAEADWERYPKGRIQAGELLIEVKGKAEKIAVVPDGFPSKTLVSGTCFKLTTKNADDRYFLAAYLTCCYGQLLKDRLKTNLLVSYLAKDDLYGLPVPNVSPLFKANIRRVFNTCFANQNAANNSLATAEKNLETSLGLENWQVPEPLSYVRNSLDAFTTGRLDAEYFQPKYKTLYQKLASEFELLTLAQLGLVTKGVTVPYVSDGKIPIIRSGDLSNIDDDSRFLRANAEENIFELKHGDVLISSIGFGSIGKVQVFDKPGRYGTVGEVTVIRQETVNPYFLAAFFRSHHGQMQIEQAITGATGQLHLYPKDVAKFWIPRLPDKQQADFESHAKTATISKQRATQLLDVAKRAVEIAIEDSEAAALAYLEGVHP